MKESYNPQNILYAWMVHINIYSVYIYIYIYIYLAMSVYMHSFVIAILL